MKKYFVAIMILSTLLCGCGRGGEKASEPAEPGVIDYITGREQVKTHQKTKSKIEDINNTLQERNAGIN